MTARRRIDGGRDLVVLGHEDAVAQHGQPVDLAPNLSFERDLLVRRDVECHATKKADVRRTRPS